MLILKCSIVLAFGTPKEDLFDLPYPWMQLSFSVILWCLLPDSRFLNPQKSKSIAPLILNMKFLLIVYKK